MSRSTISCYHHPDAVLIEDHRAGDMICSVCALVVGDRVVDVGSEWRTFSDSNADPSRVGAAENPLLENDLSTTIGRATTGAEYHNRNAMSSTNRTLMGAFRDINEIADRVGLPRTITDKRVALVGGWVDNNLRPLFNVDDKYIMKKLVYLLFPFIPREKMCHADLYIPLMSFLTYVLAAGYMLGLKDKFSPEQLGMLSSSAILCLTLEVGLILVLFHIFSVKTSFSLLHHVAFCGYKFVPMIAAMMFSLAFQSTGYYCTIAYSTLALGYFMIKSFHIAIESGNNESYNYTSSKTGIYIVGLFALIQPLLMFWLSYHLRP